MPDSAEALQQIARHQAWYETLDTRSRVVFFHDVQWRISARGNYWTRVYMGSLVTRITVFPNARFPGEWSFVWSREEPSDNPWEATREGDKHFNRAMGMLTPEDAERAALIDCGYIPVTPVAPAPPPVVTKPRRTRVVAEPPARKIIL